MGKKVLILSRIVDNLSIKLHKMGGFCLVIIAVLIGAEIIGRNLFGYSFSIVWEGGAYFLGASWFLSAAYTLRTGGHIRITLFSQILGEKRSWLLDLFASAMGVVICSIFFTALLQMTISSLSLHKTSFTPMQTPLFIPQAIFTLGMFMMLLQMIMRLILLLFKETPDISFEKSEELN